MESGVGAVLVDSHAHLTMFDASEVGPVLDRARAAGVHGVVVPSTGPEDLERAIALAEELSGQVVAAVGVHPHEATALDAGLKARIERSVDKSHVVAVGEIGLDYHYMSSPREDQLAELEWQLDLAAAADLPVILHNRESWSDLELVLSRRQGPVRGVCHSFAEGPDPARRVVELGLSVGISGMATFKGADNIREMIRALAAENILVETDSPYLTPVPKRGRRNEPAYLVWTAARVAEELGISEEVLAATSTRNVRTLFALDPDWPEVTG